ncbi:hypothetical protein ACJOV8_007020 [Formosa sp. 3Alg 14/1]|uniref:hypothetical protein n=1 Tax=Formosa sp. 3Alg 14/1 TaxID=3382190 RepID=UPI0039BECA11
MKTLKFTVLALLLFGSLTACVNEEMDDDMLLSPDNVEARTKAPAPVPTGGAIDEL